MQISNEKKGQDDNSIRVNSDERFEKELCELHATDLKFEELSASAASLVLVERLDALLGEREKEIRLRISMVQERDQKIEQLIQKITSIYSSKRYRVGNFIIKPIEWLLIKGKVLKP